MRILIIGPLGAGKSSLAYAINQRYHFPRLNLDEVCRNKADGSYYPLKKQISTLKYFLKNHHEWVAEGCQKHLYEALAPDIIVDMRINRVVALWRFTSRFWKAKKLIGNKISPDLPVQAYHYRKITLKKIREYDAIGREIKSEIGLFLQNNITPTIKCRGLKDYKKVFAFIEKHKATDIG